MKKIIYLNPPFGDDFMRSARWSAKTRGRVQRHPEQALMHVAVLEKAGHRCKFIEGAARNLKKEKIVKEIGEFFPDMAVIHTTTPSIYNDISYAKEIKKINDKCKIILVGAHVSAEPEDTFKIAKESVDIIARGEVDHTLKEIAEDKNLSEVLGVSFVSGGVIKHNPPRPYLDVNELPFPSWRHIDPRWYHDAIKRFPFITIYSARGCFGLCTFCRETQVVNGRKLRRRAPKLVVDEMEYDLKLFPYLKEIMFETDTFTADPKHVVEICEEIIRRGINKKITWSCNARVDIDLDILPIMKKAGCRMLMVGFEFGTDEQLNSVKKGTNVEMSKKFAKAASKLGFMTHGCFMVGAPGETKATAQKTIDFAKSLSLDTIQVSGIAVYPGTEFYEWAKKNNFIVASNWRDWVDKNREQRTLLSYPQMSKEEIDFYVDKMLKDFYLRPKQVTKMLLAIKNLDDLKRKIYGFRSFIDYFRK